MDEPDAEPVLAARLAEPFLSDVSWINAYASEGKLALTIPRVNRRDGGFNVFDISDPTAPLLIGAWEDARITDYPVTVNGSRLLFASRGIIIEYDLSDPASPRERSFDAGMPCWSATTIDRYAWLRCSGGNVIGVDLEASSGEITEVGRFTYSRSSRLDTIVANSEAVFVADSVNGLRVFDVSDPGNPKATRTVTGFTPRWASLVGDDLWVVEGSADRATHTRIYDVSDLKNPRLRVRIPESLFAVVAADGIAFSPTVQGNGIERILFEEGDVVDPRSPQVWLPLVWQSR